MGRILHKGIWYWPTFTEARTFAIENDMATARIIAYDMGWAIQREISGPYWGPKGWR